MVIVQNVFFMASWLPNKNNQAPSLELMITMTQFNAPTYEIERPTNRCAMTGRELEPGEAYMATLVEVVPEEEAADDAGGDTGAAAPQSTAAMFGLRRLDVSLEAWKEGKHPDNLFGYWKTTVPHPNQKPQLFVDNDVLLNLLRRLADATQPRRLAFRFVLALILMRKKMLRYDRTEQREAAVTTEDGQTQQVQQEWWIMTPKLDPSKGPLGKWHDDETIEVLNPQLGEAEITQVTEQLNEILNAEL